MRALLSPLFALFITLFSFSELSQLHAQTTVPGVTLEDETQPGPIVTISPGDESDVNSDGEYNEKFSSDKRGSENAWSNLLSIIAALAVGITATLAVIHCLGNLSPSLIVFIGAGIAIIIGEIINALSQKKSNENNVEFLENAPENSKQIAALQAQAQAAEDRAQALEKRASMQKTAGTLTLTASAVALAMGIYQGITLLACATCGYTCASDLTLASKLFFERMVPNYSTTCSYSRRNQYASAAKCALFVAVDPYATVCCKRDMSFFSSFRNKDPFFQFTKLPQDAAFQASRMFTDDKEVDERLIGLKNYDQLAIVYDEMRLAGGKTSSLSITEYRDTKKVVKNSSDPGLINDLSKVLRNVSDFIFPSAHAQDFLITMGIAGGFLLGLWLATKVVVANLFLNLVADPFIRSALFGAFGGIFMLASSISQKSADKAKAEAQAIRDEIERLIAESAPSVDDVAGTAAPNAPPPNFPEPVNYETGLDGQICIGTGTTGNPTGIDSNCSCKKTKSCFTSQATGDLSPFGNLTASPLLVSTIREGNAVLNAGARGRLGRASTLSDTVNRRAGAINKLRKQLQKKANEQFKKLGKKPIDFKKLRKSFDKKLSNGFSKALANTGKKADLKDLLKGSSSIIDQGLRNDIAAVSSKPGGGIFQPGAGGSFNLGDMQFDLDEAIEDDTASLDELKTQELTGLQIENDDVNKDKTKSLWKIISHRYLRSIPVLSGDQEKIK